MFIKFAQWLVLSSKNAGKVSLTIKGALTMIVPIVIAVSGITPDQADSLIDATLIVVEQGLFIVSAATMIWGAIRKIYSTFTGENVVIKAQVRGDL